MEILGIDVGGSGIKGAKVDITTGTLTTERHRIETPQPATPVAVANTIKEVVQHFDWKGPIGCGFPAVIQKGIVRTASNIHESWKQIDAVTLFSEVTGCSVKIANDADVAGLAEMHFGAGKGEDGTVVLITVGTGLGSAIFTEGKLLTNTEFGHLHFKGDIAEKYAADSARKREDLSWKKWSKRFNNYLEELERLFYPDLFIIGGGASKKFEKYDDAFTVEARVVPAQLLNEAGIVGAALYGQ